MAIRQTSLKSYYELRDTSRLSEMQSKVYNLIKKFPGLTDREIAKELGYSDPNNIRPRRNELVKDGFVEELPKRKCSIPPYRMAYTWGAL